MPGWVDLGYRISNAHYVGLYGSIGLPSRKCEEAWVADQVITTVDDCAAIGYRFGLNYAYRLPLGASLAPWVGVGVGYEGLHATQKHIREIILDEKELSTDVAEARGNLSGLKANLQVGIDFITAGTFGIGPFVTFSAGQYLSSNLPGPPGFDAAGGDPHFWLFAGVRFVNR